MDAETWMDANKAVELGFADEIMQRPTVAAPVQPDKDDDEDEDDTSPGTPGEEDDEKDKPKASMLFSRKAVNTSLVNKLRHRMIAEAAQTKPAKAKPTGRSVDELRADLDRIKNYI